VQQIRSAAELADDFEAAHELEKTLWHRTLLAIRDGHDAPRELAAIALTTTLIPFKRAFA